MENYQKLLLQGIALHGCARVEGRTLYWEEQVWPIGQLIGGASIVLIAAAITTLFRMERIWGRF